MLITGTANYTIEMENGEEIHSCRCGQTHRGEYAVYKFGHHNCLHGYPLAVYREAAMALCPGCGNSWEWEELN